MSDRIRVFTFPPAAGLPTAGPFGLKLIVSLRLMGVEHDVLHEFNPNKGPRRKSPWIEDGGQRIGDTELILEHLRVTRGVDLDADLSSREAGLADALRRMIEEHLHQVLEWEMFIDEGGWRAVSSYFDAVPWPARGLVKTMMRRQLTRHLYERGVGRLTPEEIAWKAARDIDAIDALLESRDWLVADRPCTADASAFGMLAPMVYGPLPGPTSSRAKASQRIVAFCGRMRARAGI